MLRTKNHREITTVHILLYPVCPFLGFFQSTFAKATGVALLGPLLEDQGGEAAVGTQAACLQGCLAAGRKREDTCDNSLDNRGSGYRQRVVSGGLLVPLEPVAGSAGSAATRQLLMAAASCFTPP